MKKALLVFLGFFLLFNHTLRSQSAFTAYDKSSSSAKVAWDQFYSKGIAPDVSSFDESNPFDRSIKFLVAAGMHVVADSVINWTVSAILTCRDELDSLPYIIPIEVEKFLSRNIRSGREYFLDGLMQLYYLAPWQCAEFIKERRQIYMDNKNETMTAHSFVNEALLYSEVIGQPKLALPLIDSAMNIWVKTGNSIQIANTMKAKGNALLRLNKFEEAEKEIKTAISLFNKNDVQYGSLSCQLDLVLLFAKTGEPDSMKKYDQICRPEFEKNDTMLLFVLNTYRLAAYQSANQYSIREIAKQNSDLLFAAKFHPAMVIEYYKNSIKAFVFFDEAVLLKNHKLEYDNLKQELLKLGYWPGLFK